MAVFVHDALLFIALVGSAVYSARRRNGWTACFVMFLVCTIAPWTLGGAEFDGLNAPLRYVTGEWAFAIALAVSGAIMLRYQPALPPKDHWPARWNTHVLFAIVVVAYMALSLFIGMFFDSTTTLVDHIGFIAIGGVAIVLWIMYLLRAAVRPAGQP